MDFPILQTDNDSYYLKRSFTHRYTDLGNPFLLMPIQSSRLTVTV